MLPVGAERAPPEAFFKYFRFLVVESKSWEAIHNVALVFLRGDRFYNWEQLHRRL
jgi:hypothetical protein